MLVLLVRTSDAIVVGGIGDQLGKLFLELRAAVSLDRLTVSEIGHKHFEGCFSILHPERSEQAAGHLTLAAMDVKRRESPEVNRVHLDDLARLAG